MGKVIEDVIKRIRDAKQIRIKAGVLGGAKYLDGTSVADVAAKNEFGSPTNPMRPFLRTTLANNADDWAEGMGKMLGQYLAGKRDLDDVCNRMGVAMQTGILETIDSDMPPPNSEATRKRKLERLYDPKGSGTKEQQIAAGVHTITTLVDSGLMRDSISYDYDIGQGNTRFLGDD